MRSDSYERASVDASAGRQRERRRIVDRHRSALALGVHREKVHRCIADRHGLHVDANVSVRDIC